jgi:hypothetical protein
MLKGTAKFRGAFSVFANSILFKSERPCLSTKAGALD